MQINTSALQTNANEKVFSIEPNAAANKGWQANISVGYKFKHCMASQVQVSYAKTLKSLYKKYDFSPKLAGIKSISDTTVHYKIAQALIDTQYEYLCQLLRANTCHTIYFDANFSQEQLDVIKVLQARSRTELVNSRLMYLFSDKRQA
jgi:hypothetical protein